MSIELQNRPFVEAPDQYVNHDPNANPDLPSAFLPGENYATTSENIKIALAQYAAENAAVPTATEADINLLSTHGNNEVALAQPSAEPAARASVRWASRFANRLSSFADNMAGRRTTREYAKDKAEQAKDVAIGVGAAVVNSIDSTGQTIAINYNEMKATGRENISRFKGFLHDRADAARNRKNIMLAGLKQGAEKSREVGVKSARLAGEVGLVVLGAGVQIDAAAGRTVVRGAKATGRGVNAAANKVGEGLTATNEFAKRRTAAVVGRTILARAGVTGIKANVQGRFAARSAEKVAKHATKEANRTAKLETTQARIAGHQERAVKVLERAAK